MTRQGSFKRLVRARMARTGERYAAARAALLSPDETSVSRTAPFPTSDDTIRARTGRGWEEWFDLLDEQGAGDQSHREIARWVADQLAVDPLEWGAQAITLSYERARGGRAVGERSDGFAVTASKTVDVPVDRLFAAFTGESERRRWLEDGQLQARSGTAPRSARFKWGDGSSRVSVTFDVKSEARSVVTVEHARLANAQEADRMKAYWRERLVGLKSHLEGQVR